MHQPQVINIVLNINLTCLGDGEEPSDPLRWAPIKNIGRRHTASTPYKFRPMEMQDAAILLFGFVHLCGQFSVDCKRIEILTPKVNRPIIFIYIFELFMKSIIVVNKVTDWPLKGLDIEVVTADDYLKESRYNGQQTLRVLNLCRSYAYQKLGYYVSLVASARGHKPQPSLTCIEDFKSPSMIRFISHEFDELIQDSLRHIHSDSFTMSIYFGRNVAKCYDRLANYLFKQFPAPFLQARFTRVRDKWILASIGPLSLSQIPEYHEEFAKQQAEDYLKARKSLQGPRKKATRYDLAILVNPEEGCPPSNKRALARFAKAAESIGLSTEFIGKGDFGRVAEFDALFIRETTQVNHHTYRFARRASANGLVVIDDPLSILRCCNKIFLYALLEKYRIPIPYSFVIDRDIVPTIAEQITYPVVLKLPDSFFSQGVVKANDAAGFIEMAGTYLEKSDLILVQEFLPSGFDWRIGVLDGQPLYACKYYMVKDHWQILKKTKSGKVLCGNADTVSIEQVPRKAVSLAVRASNLVGKGLYGVDIKEVNGKFYIIEVNDNPSIDAGVEDSYLGDQLYINIMTAISNRIDKKKEKVFHATNTGQ